jgi:hypothetical protein
LCSGCGFAPDHRYYAPTMSFELVENNGWKLIAPSREWVIDVRRALLRKYFSSTTISIYGHMIFNYFYATYPLDSADEIALFVNHPASFIITKTVRSGEILYGMDASNCAGTDDTNKIIVLMHRVNVEFDNTSVYFLRGTRKIQGLQYAGKQDFWMMGEKLEPAMHDLSPVLVYPYGPDKPFLSTMKSFYFSFEHMTCQDYEDAVFVIDGFYYQGKRLPPLKVRMNYYDFSMVPEYAGGQESAR